MHFCEGSYRVSTSRLFGPPPRHFGPPAIIAGHTAARTALPAANGENVSHLATSAGFAMRACAGSGAAATNMTGKPLPHTDRPDPRPQIGAVQPRTTKAVFIAHGQ